MSCPATIPVLRAQNLDIQLSEAAATFLKKEMEIHTKFQGDTKKQIVTLPKICEIYKSDFGESGMDVLKFCAGELEEEFASEFLESLTTEEKSLEIRYKEASESYHSAFVIERDSALQINQVVLNADDPRIKDDFSSYTIAVSDRLFNQLKSSVWSEEMSRGRRSAVLVMNDQTRGTPIVRTTNKCNVPSMYFPIAYNRLAQHIQKTLSLPTAFNNAVIENYSNEYGNSSFQSDQSLDLQDGSVIALFSCYRDPELGNQTPRKLVIQSKEPRGDVFQIPLTHNSVVIFSLDTNQRFRHKIVVDAEADSPENLWLGVTFRTSKTFVEYHEDSKRAVLEDGAPLTLANDTQSLEFYRLVRRENQETNFVYPKLTYSISEGDIMPPTNMR